MIQNSSPIHSLAISTGKNLTSDPDVIWTRNHLNWSQTRYRCATKPSDCHTPSQGNISDTRYNLNLPHIGWFLSQTFFSNKMHEIEIHNKPSLMSLSHSLTLSWQNIPSDPNEIWTHNLWIWSQTRYHCATKPSLRARLIKSVTTDNMNMIIRKRGKFSTRSQAPDQRKPT